MTQNTDLHIRFRQQMSNRTTRRMNISNATTIPAIAPTKAINKPIDSVSTHSLFYVNS